LKAKFILFSLLFYSMFQTNVIGRNNETFINDGKHFLNVGLGLWNVPKSFQKDDWIKLGVITSVTGMLFFIDDDIQQFALKHQNSRNDRIFNLDKIYGNKYTIAMTVGIYGLGFIFDEPEIRRMGLNSFESFLYSALLMSTLKMAFGRHRPDVGDGQWFFEPGQIKDPYQSLPSGHATVSVAVSTAMAKSIDNVLWKIFWYSGGALVAMSRVYHNRHWVSDVFFGAAIGYYVADFVVKYDKKSNRSLTGKIFPFANTNGIGLAVTF
jgi:membrane-associated phospholipid phosphatase